MSENVEPLRLTTPAELLAVIPRQMQFVPERSIVGLALRSDGRIGLISRIDIPSAAQLQEACAALCTAMVNYGDIAEVLIVAYEDRPGQSTSATLLTVRALAACGIRSRDVITVRDGRWWRTLCQDPNCCPPEGHEIVPISHIEAAFEAVGNGPVAPSRLDLEARFQSQVDPADPAWVHLRERAQPALCLDTWASIIRGEEVSLVDGAKAARCVVDLDFRDALIAHIAPGAIPHDVVASTYPASWAMVSTLPVATSPTTLHGLEALVRRLPDVTMSVPLITLTAHQAWYEGIGAETQVLTARALHIQPQYRLAAMIRTMVDNNIRPADWGEAPPRIEKPTWQDVPVHVEGEEHS